MNVDDEGQPTQETVLIENGILKGYLSDKLSSKLMGIADTGNGRRESYEHIPMPRMTNTYMLPGNDDPHPSYILTYHKLGAVKLEVDLITKAKLIAADQGKPLAGYLSDSLRQVVDRDWAKMIRKTLFVR